MLSVECVGMVTKQFYSCSCYYSHNIFLRRYSLHCVYHDEHQFQQSYREVLREKGCETERLYQEALSEERASLRRLPHVQRVGWGVLHRAKHMHEAQAITEGDRHNLIIWMRASSVRNKQCPMCDQPPALLHSKLYGDGFTSLTRLCSGVEQSAESSYCTAM